MLTGIPDLDLAIRCPEPLTPEVMEALMDAFSESDLPILVDISDWHDLSEGMRNMIEVSVHLPKQQQANVAPATQPGRQ